MKVRTLSNKEKKQLNKTIQKFYNVELIKKHDEVKIIDNFLYLINNKPLLFNYSNLIVPTLHLIREDNFLKKIYVNQGAIKPIINGADIMRPGITRYEEFDINEIVSIISEDYNNPIAIGISLVKSKELSNIEKGKVIKNIHHLNDKIWNFKTNIL